MPCTVNGARPRPPSSISTPRCAQRRRSGRRWAGRAAAGRRRRRPGRRRARRPAAGTAARCRPARRRPRPARAAAAGVTSQSAPSSSIPTPSARRPAAIRSVSRARSGRTIRLGPSASAARTSARAVIDLEPGRVTTASTGVERCGVVQTVGHGLILPGRPPAAPLARPAQPACGLSAFFDRDRAHQPPVGELEHGQLGQLAAVAGPLHAAEGQLGGGAGGLVDPHHAGLEPVGHRRGPGRGRCS